jgi:hypothetical protein
MMIPLSQIEPVECRSQNLMHAYALMMIEHKKAPAVVLARKDDQNFDVVDGRHRVCAARHIGRKKIKAHVIAMPEAVTQ